jgi:Rieske Fe-S protein
MSSKVTRRTLLVLAQGGVTSAAFAGCAVLSGGARHPLVGPGDQTLAGDRLTISAAGLAAAQPGGVLEVKPGSGHPDLLLLAPAAGGSLGGSLGGSWRAVTAHCTHKGCVVGWNAAGGEWKCPCHGSRYTPDGQVIAGPAERPLQAAPVHFDGDSLVVDLAGLTM